MEKEKKEVREKAQGGEHLPPDPSSEKATDKNKGESESGKEPEQTEKKANVSPPGGQNGAVEGELVKPDAEVVKEQERTRIKKKLFLQFYEATLGSVKDSCEKADVGRTTFEEWRNGDKAFAGALEEYEMRKLEDVERMLNSKIMQGSDRAITYFLDRRHPKYRPKLIVEPGGSIEDEFDQDDEIEDTESHGGTLQAGQSAGDGTPVQDQGQEGPHGAVQT